MALVDLPGSELPSASSAWPISADSRNGPWAGANFLVVGPAGSGKLSLVRAISQALDPRIRLSLLDFETESRSQRQLLNHLRETRIEDHGGQTQPAQAIILRHIHRLAPRRMTELITICRTLTESSAKTAVIFHATSHYFAEYSGPLKRELKSFFHCLIQWTGFSWTEGRIRQFVTDVIADLNRRYGQHILGVDPPVMALVQRMSERSNLYELRNVIERAYFREESSRLSMNAVAAACPRTESRAATRKTKGTRRKSLVN